MRILRSTYNKAVDLQLTRQTCPFRSVYTGIDQTQKRAISESIIVQLYKTSLPTGALLEFAKDLFIFSYCTRGMSFVDMAFLAKADECKLTSYTARPSWATNALRHEIPIAVISKGLGHTTEKTARIYLAALKSPILDKANDKILAALDE